MAGQGDLTSANQVRAERAGFKKAVRTGEISAAEIINDPPEVMCGMQIVQLLTAIPGIQMTRARRILDEVDLDATTTMGDVPYQKAVALGIKVSRFSRRRTTPA
jgi:hypothetical protein